MSRYAKMRKSNAQDILYLKPEYGDIITEISEYLQEEGMCAYELEKNREELVKTAKAAIKKEQSMEEALGCPPGGICPGKKPVICKSIRPPMKGIFLH